MIKPARFTKKQKTIALLLTIISTFFIISATYQANTPRPVPAEQSSYKVIIFDLGNVLFATSKKSHRLIGLTVLKNPLLLYYLINFAAKKEYFKMLHAIPAQSNVHMYHESEHMPQIMVDWLTCTSTSHDIKHHIMEHIKTTSHPPAIRNLFAAITEFMFTPDSLATSQTPITDMVNLSKSLKKSGYKLFALSNWDIESFAILLKNHNEIFELFDGIVISGEEKIGKPAQEFYQRLLQKHHLKNSECVFIDDEAQNVQAAQQLGIYSIICKTPAQVTQELVKIGILTYSDC